MTAAESLFQTPEPPISTCPIPEEDDSLRDAITTLAGHINAAEYRFVKQLQFRNSGDSLLNYSVRYLLDSFQTL